MPGWLLVVSGGGMAMWTSYWGWALSRVVPAYFEAAAEAKAFDTLGIGLGFAILGIAAQTWCAAEITVACRAELRKRFFN
jgi:hypothetical protein